MIRNARTKKILAEKEIICTSKWSHGRGLMFSRPKPLVFKFAKNVQNTFHMFFVFYPIDVIFLNAEKKIVDIKKNFRPFMIYKPESPYRFAIELQAGSIDRTKTKIGDFVSFK